METVKKNNVRLCPKCKKGQLDNRVRRGFFVKNFLFWLPLKRYLCYTCTRKTYVYEPSNS
jgi:hypothetical protein